MEVMVSVTIFTIIVTIGMGSLMTIFKTLQKTRADRQTIDSISYVLDTMTRRIRTGKDYVVTSSSIKFMDQDGQNVSFFAEPDSNGVNRLYVTDGLLSNQSIPVDVTPENFALQSFELEVVGDDPNDYIQPIVKISLVGFVKNGQQQSRLAVQTAVSQRFLDFPALTQELSGENTPELNTPTDNNNSLLNPTQLVPRQTPRNNRPRNNASVVTDTMQQAQTSPDATGAMEQSLSNF